ncbi:PGF-CTERM sorting domain-containing protein [Haloterrigena alkaliphila]|uniref:PGF-CTERM sorting domain-containing protein n=1 Tax=Haloterrigena alkaliphila TaxID=2816475 RepID=A0A8A2VHS5_9EURY|nr:PGF-CTERM sorting domain-containing protein [Haloterrigena alkaliphila]QSX00897.1 PGF-CTERM sorting domain-containing protein [Haloterrigena alkaliphila]
MTISDFTKAVLGLALLTTLLVGFAAIGTAATTEQYNDTVTFENDSNVTVDVTWNDSISDVENASASVTFYNASEWNDDPANATVVLEDSIAAEEGNTTSTEYTDADGLEDGTDYRLVIEADDTEAEDISVDDGSGWYGLIPGGSDGSPGFGAGIAVVAIALIAVVAVVARRGS